MKKTSRKLRPKEEWIIVPIPAIIEPDIFERAGRQLKENFALCKRNRKNEYLLSGKIECVCGRKRAGEGYYNKPNLYYRGSDRVLSFPLPPKCEEKGINARLADELVWQKISQLMSSPKLLAEQVSRWFKERHNKNKSTLVDIEALKNEAEKLKGQVERYNKGYGAGAFSIEQLKDYTTPIKEKITQLKTQIANATNEAAQLLLATPNEREMEVFAVKSKQTLQDLKFAAKRAIILNTVDKIIGDRNHLQVTGYIPLYVQFSSLHRHCRPAQRGQVHPV